MRLLPAMPLLLLALLALGGCNRTSYDTPEKAYKSFLQAVQRGDEKAAYAVLSQPTQEALKARAQAAADASAGAVKADPVAFFFANVPPPADVTEVTLSSQEGDVAKVSVVFSNGKSQVRMVREPTGWKIDLTQSLQQP
ncbi:DUF4878 domain-containing protein [Vitiosangium sp. GDMCC 1.1324]|uniref:DUF4878 domain-containing protein n=1 Tax=Vitiosangium sp. (strain GDMCC 1.1324) TaxID=2138576 RepID=UPI000D348F73|nr:DUF4878 domain-containing protein [Vitiosangium sp. GDMCC 1.1324]PTL78557.1 hypothetical protein DAT35_39225 [Vitiosangium sp. GDMCC 1.1324]